MGNDSQVQGRNPGQTSALYQVPVKDSDPYAKQEEKNITTVNPLKGLFQQQPQYPSPGKTEMFPEAVPKHLGNDSDVQGRSPGQAGAVYQTKWADPDAKPAAEGSKDDRV
ncbi:MAG: hypothetical protein K2X27_23195, partial [Candidatus Obscuribacterales bacterium]|nr:hypothetical protein [Candidatus Obscuribacterales bacterium]